jgi:hypothetical protein
MNLTPTEKRFAFFLGGCIPARVGLAFLAKYLSSTPALHDYYKLFGYLLLLPAFGFLYLFFTGKRTSSGPETFGERIWWNKFRLLHGIIYLLFCYNAIFNPYFKFNYLFLLLDALFGLVVFILHNSNIFL